MKLENRPYTDLELREFASNNNIKLNGIYADNNIPPKVENFIVNLQSDKEDGSHWVGVCIKNKIAYVFDSLGDPPDDKLQNYLKKRKLKIVHNPFKFQQDKSALCGWFAMYFIIQVGNNNMKFFEFLKLFDASKLSNNDKLLKKYFE